MKITSKILAFLLAVTLCVGFVPMFASAATNPVLSLVGTAPDTSKSQFEVTININGAYLTSAQLYVTYDSNKVSFTKGELITGSSADIANSVNDTAGSRVLVNFASVNTACTNKAFYKLYFTIKSGASGKCNFGLAAKNVYVATDLGGDGTKAAITANQLNGTAPSVPEVSSITTPSRPNAFYSVGEISALDISKFTVEATYGNDYKEKIGISSCTYAYYKNNAGKFTKVTFDGKTAGNYILRITYKKVSCEFKFIVSDSKAKAVSINTMPKKDHYILGSKETLDLTGLVLSVTAADNTVKTVSVTSVNMENFVINGFDINSAGKQALEIVYSGVKTTLNVFVGYQIGDVDGDNKISAADARLALRCAVKLEKLNEIQMDAADVDGEAGISSADARLILRCSVKLEVLK